MISRLGDFFHLVFGGMNNFNTMRMSVDQRFQNMTRQQLLDLRDDCYRLAEMITGYISYQDSRDDEPFADDFTDSPF